MCCSRPNAADHEHMENPYKEAKKQCQLEIRGDSGRFQCKQNISSIYSQTEIPFSADDSFDPFDCEKMKQIKEQMVCITECVAKKFNLIDEKSGEMKRDELVKEILKKTEKLQWSKEKVEPMVDACLAEIKEKKADTETKGCHHTPLDFHRCVWKFEYLEGCPAEQRVDSPKCNKIRERVGKGDTSFLNKHLLHHFHHIRHEE